MQIAWSLTASLSPHAQHWRGSRKSSIRLAKLILKVIMYGDYFDSVQQRYANSRALQNKIITFALTYDS